ncbi:riboflavin synthase [Rhodohalobacter barkolensis]|uniref:Riboflavin synthase n=1 Tax=Rhodohalobacter barkolensis TaxID=2053187 RepID=A0A2N0VHK2_9BACT|nr:riboflavin synthase [Rhodohalobacter barkolensis]PKD43671.1 riboflavin synthase [Rhodohalobacter barkolensis]
MFTGIVSEIGDVTEIKKIKGGQELSIKCSFADDVHVDESIAINGVCHTVVSHTDDVFKVQSVEETLRKTNLGDLEVGNPVNLERSLTLNKAIEGHIVQGHVDTTGTIKKIDKDGADLLITIEFPEEYRDYIVGRGSISIDGISLTIARNEGNLFTVAIIPYTWDETNLHAKKIGDRVNLEFDIFGKYIIQYLQNREQK